MSRLQSSIKAMGQIKYNIISTEIIFKLYLVSKHCSEFPKLVKIY
jgi:hypothetical protein